MLDLQHRRWQGEPLGEADFVLSADEKTQLQIRERRHPSTPPGPGRPMRVEHEYRRHGTCAYQAAWDVHQARLFGHVVPPRSTIETFDRLVAHVMLEEPCIWAHRVFWIVDNGGIHRGRRAIERLESRWPPLHLVHLPVHASWLNQIEIYFSVVARKAWTPDDCTCFEAARERLLGFQEHHEAVARPSDWRFTRADLDQLLARYDAHARLAA